MKTGAALPTIEISGDRRELGRQHGEAARSQIRDSIGYYRESFKRMTGLEWSEIRRNAPRWVPPIESYLPGIGDEIRGIAEGARVDFPQPIIRRKLLEASEMQSALRAVFDSRQSLCTNLVVTHRDGFAIDLETTPDRHGWMYPTDGLLVHTNHFMAFVPEQIAATYRPFSVNSLWRLPRLTEGLRAAKDPGDPATIRGAIGAALRDHFGYPNAVCKHGDEASGGTDLNQTIASSIVDLTTGEYWIASGNPCENEYRLLPWNLYQEATVSARPLAAIR